MPSARVLIPFLAAAAAAAAVPVGAEEKAPDTEREAARPPTKGRVLNLEFVSCADYLRLSELQKAPVAWYLAGFYRATGVSPLEFDLEWATSTPPIVTMECAKRPDASLLYVVGNLFKPHTREKGKGKAKP